jgi:hypothetical protein
MHVFAVVVCSAAVDLALAVGGGAAAGTTRRAPEVVLGIVVVTLARSFAALITAVLYFDLVARDRNR